MEEKKIVVCIRQLRLERAAQIGRAITLRDVSTATGIAVSTLSRLETGRAKGIEFATLEKLATYYGVTSMDALLAIAGDDMVDNRGSSAHRSHRRRRRTVRVVGDLEQSGDARRRRYR